MPYFLIQASLLTAEEEGKSKLKGFFRTCKHIYYFIKSS